MTKQKINVIIFDLVGVLFNVNKFKVLRKLGIARTLYYILKYRRNPFHDGLKLLEKIRLEIPEQYQNEMTFKGMHLPLSLCQWQQGLITSNEVVHKFTDYINQFAYHNHFHHPFEQRAMITLIETLLDNTATLKAFEPNYLTISLVRVLKKRGYTLLMLTNLDHESYEGIIQKYPDVFALFDGVVTSSNANLVKPQPEIYYHLLDAYKLQPKQCCFIDDQQENINTAQKIGMHTILFKNWNQLETALKKLGIL